MSSRFRIALAVLAGVLCTAAVSLADAVRLTNGDTINGQVLRLDGEKLTLESDIHGELVIDRDKVVSIVLGDRMPGDHDTQQLPAAQPTRPRPAQPAAKKKVTGIGGTPEDVVEKLQAAGGIDPQELDRLMNKFPLLATPEVQQHFNRYLGGLTSGELDLADLRKDAVKARDELKDLKKDLGPYGGALDGYLSILESFIDETKPAQPEKNKPGNPEQKTP